MLLNLGSGPHAWREPGVINLDLYPDDKPDICGTIYALPFKSCSFDRAYLGHVLEHLTWERIPEALLELRRVLRKDAEVCVVGPCMERAVKLAQPDWLLEQISARPHPEEPGIYHEWTPTTLLTKIAMERGGLLDIQGIALSETLRPRYPNQVGAEWQCAFIARNP